MTPPVRPAMYYLRWCALGCFLLVLVLGGAAVALLVEHSPATIARWRNRPQARVVIRPGMTKAQVERESGIELGEHGRSDLFVDFLVSQEGILLRGITMFMVPEREDGRVNYVNIFTARETWPRLLDAATATEETLLRNGWKPEAHQRPVRSLRDRSPRKAAYDVTESGEIEDAHFVYRRGEEKFILAAVGTWSGISWWEDPYRASVFWRHMYYFPLRDSNEPDPNDPRFTPRTGPPE